MPRTGLPSDEIFIVDDDVTVREGLAAMFLQEGFRPTAFPDGPSFVATARARVPAGVVLDVYMPSGSGLEVLKEIDARNYPAPILVISGRGDIPSAVQAIRDGAHDFVEKQASAETICARVREAVTARARRMHNGRDAETISLAFPGGELLTPRERDVLTQIADAASSREAARALGISQRTVEIHRGHIMQKLGAKNSVDLMRIVLRGRRA